MPRNFHFELIAIFFSALIHAAVAIPYFSGKFTSASNKQTTTPLKLAMFKTAPEPVKTITPEPPKPVTPPPKPVKPKPVVKKKTKPIVKPKPRPMRKPVVETKIEPPKPEVEPQPEIVQAAPPPQPVAALEAEPEKMMHDPGLITRLEDEYRLTLSKLIDASKDYPRRAQRRNIEGRAIVSFLVLSDGTVKQIRVIDSTGHKILDKAVIKAIQAVSGKLPFPEKINRLQWQFEIPLSFNLS
jgi:periplasmic protein TonB